MAFGTKKSVVAAPSFSERMASIKSMFKTAHENASNPMQRWSQRCKEGVSDCCIAGRHQNYWCY